MLVRFCQEDERQNEWKGDTNLPEANELADDDLTPPDPYEASDQVLLRSSVGRIEEVHKMRLH